MIPNQTLMVEEIETIEDNHYKSLMKSDIVSSNNQDYKLKLDFILHHPKAPFYIFGGIFQSFGIDKETGQKYYNYLDILKQQQQQQQQQQPSNDQINKEIMTVNALNNLLLRKINQ